MRSMAASRAAAKQMNQKPTHTHLALVTAPDQATARQLAQASLSRHLVACANLIPALESMYWWQGKIETDQEWLIVFKTSSENLAELQDLIIREHPYDVPEFISLPIEGGSPDYLRWILNECRPKDGHRVSENPESQSPS